MHWVVVLSTAEDFWGLVYFLYLSREKGMCPRTDTGGRLTANNFFVINSGDKGHVQEKSPKMLHCYHRCCFIVLNQSSHQEAALHSFFELRAAIAQLGERQTEDLKVPASIPGLGNLPSELHHPQFSS